MAAAAAAAGADCAFSAGSLWPATDNSTIAAASIPPPVSGVIVRLIAAPRWGRCTTPRAEIEGTLARRLSPLVAERHGRLLIDDQRLHELVRRAGARHVDADRQDARGAALQIDHRLRRLDRFLLPPHRSGRLRGLCRHGPPLGERGERQREIDLP